MVFHSATFLLTIAVLTAVFWRLPWQRGRLVLLLLASLVFYSWKHWPSVFLLLAIIGFNYVLGRLLERRPEKRLLMVGVAANLAVLLHFKYSTFFVTQLVSLSVALGHPLEAPKPSLWAPLGVSFFTFQVIAYLVDVYRREIPAEKNLLVFAVFKSFFAQLVAGPIVRGHDFLPQLHHKGRFDPERLHRGAWLLLFGLFIKVGVADVIGEWVDFAWGDLSKLGANNAWLLVYAYTAQLLADFWGYSVMAIGLGLLFGLVLPPNFDNPYASQSLREFWRRWHITLSRWLRDYLYISLGGNRGVSKGRAAFNRLLTMALGGLWHGPGWNFILWGTLHGVWMDLELATERLRVRWPKWVGILITFHVVALLWVPFRAPTMGQVGALLSRMVSPAWDIDMPAQIVLLTSGFLLAQKPLFALVRGEKPQALRPWVEVLLAALMVWLMLAYGNARPDFIYYVF